MDNPDIHLFSGRVEGENWNLGSIAVNCWDLFSDLLWKSRRKCYDSLKAQLMILKCFWSITKNPSLFLSQVLFPPDKMLYSKKWWQGKTEAAGREHLPHVLWCCIVILSRRIYGVLLQAPKRVKVSFSLTQPSRKLWYFPLWQPCIRVYSHCIHVPSCIRCLTSKRLCFNFHSPVCCYPFEYCGSTMPKQIIQILLWMDLLFLLADWKEPPSNLKHC